MTTPLRGRHFRQISVIQEKNENVLTESGRSTSYAAKDTPRDSYQNLRESVRSGIVKQNLQIEISSNSDEGEPPR